MVSESLTLREVVERVLSYEDGLVLYIPASGKVSPDTAVIVDEYAGPRAAPPGMREMMSIEDVKTTLEAWSRYHPGKEATVDDGCAAVIYFHENDAYLP